MTTLRSSENSSPDDYLLWAERAHSLFDYYSPSMVAVDTETTGVAYWDQAFCATVSFRTEDGVTNHYFELSEPEVCGHLRAILKEAPAMVFHNPKFDLHKLTQLGLMDRADLDPLNIHDTECLAHLIDEHQPKGLKVLARNLLGEDTDEEEAIRTAFRKAKLKKSDGYHLLPREIIIPYALKDTEFTLRLWELLYPQVRKFDDLHGLYQQEQKLSLVLMDMETAGMKLDLDYLERMVKQYSRDVLEADLEIRDMAGEEFNPNSVPQIRGFFADHGITVEATDKDALQELNHPLSLAILKLRQLSKMLGTYLKPMLRQQRDGIIHPWFRQHGAKTGRMASGGASNG